METIDEIKAQIRNEDFQDAPRILGVDVGFGDDETVLLLRQGKACFRLVGGNGNGMSLRDWFATLECTTMDFGEAIRALKAGKRVARSGWNGKGMWLAYQKAYPDGIPINANTAEATGIPPGTVCKFLPYLMMKTAGGEFVPWLASQTDVLAEDWVEVRSNG